DLVGYHREKSALGAVGGIRLLPLPFPVGQCLHTFVERVAAASQSAVRAVKRRYDAGGADQHLRKAERYSLECIRGNPYRVYDFVRREGIESDRRDYACDVDHRPYGEAPSRCQLQATAAGVLSDGLAGDLFGDQAGTLAG